jgi:hypothetical protein
MTTTTVTVDRASLALQDLVGAERAQVEAGLDAGGWPWSKPLSLLIDALVLIEEADKA